MASLFRCIAQSKILTTTVSTLTLGAAFMTLIFSMKQYGNKAEFSCNAQKSNCDWTKDICNNELITYLSPFKFDVTNLGLHGTNQCGWSHTNSLFRILVCAMIIMCSMLSILFIMCLKVYNGQHKIEWNILKILYLLLSILVLSALVLDCQSLHIGYESCKNNFVGINNRKIFYAWNIGNCYLNPYVNVIYFDAGTVLLCTFSFILHGLIPPTVNAYNYKKDDNYISINSVKEETKKATNVSAYNTSADKSVSAYNTSFDDQSTAFNTTDNATDYKTTENDVECNPTDSDLGTFPDANQSYRGAYN